METSYEETFTVTESFEDIAVCTAWNNSCSITETMVPRVFLEAYDIYSCDSFYCQVDCHGGILLETIEKMKMNDFHGE